MDETVGLEFVIKLYCIDYRLFSDDSEDSIQFMADSDEQLEDSAVVNKASVCTSTDVELRVVKKL